MSLPPPIATTEFRRARGNGVVKPDIEQTPDSGSRRWRPGCPNILMVKSWRRRWPTVCRRPLQGRVQRSTAGENNASGKEGSSENPTKASVQVVSNEPAPARTIRLMHSAGCDPADAVQMSVNLLKREMPPRRDNVGDGANLRHIPKNI